MLTVAPIACSPTVTPAASKAARRRSAILAASAAGDGTIAANSSPPKRAMTSSARMLARATCANSRSTSSPTAWPKRSLIDLEMVEIEQQHRQRLVVLGLKRAQLQRVLQEGAAVEQAGQFVGGGGVAIDMQVVVLDHQQHDDGGAHGVEHDLQREHREPAGGKAARQPGLHGQRHQEDRGVQHRHHHRGGARIKRLAPLAPELEGNEEGVGRNHRRAEARCGRRSLATASETGRARARRWRRRNS